MAFFCICGLVSRAGVCPRYQPKKALSMVVVSVDWSYHQHKFHQYQKVQNFTSRVLARDFQAQLQAQLRQLLLLQ